MTYVQFVLLMDQLLLLGMFTSESIFICSCWMFQFASSENVVGGDDDANRIHDYEKLFSGSLKFDYLR